MGIRQIEIAGNNNIIIHELDDVCDSNTGCPLTGSWLWKSALVLAEFMSTHLHLQNKAVLELGAGAGLPGLAAARLGATRVVLTDIKLLLPGLINNVTANGLEDRVEVRELLWGWDESEMSQLSELGEFDFVLMSDVFYDPEEMLGLGKTLKKVCGRDTTVWAVSEVRPWTSECLNGLMTQGFRVIELPCELGCEEGNSLELFAVFEIIPPIEVNYQVANICA